MAPACKTLLTKINIRLLTYLPEKTPQKQILHLVKEGILSVHFLVRKVQHEGQWQL